MPKCPKCGSYDSRTIDSRPGNDGTIRRRRVCDNCLQRYSTIEITDASFKAIQRDLDLLHTVLDYAKERRKEFL